MNVLRALLASLLLLLVAACGGGGGGGGDGGGAPSISNLRYAPTSALQQPDGTLTIDGTVDFADRDRDLVRMRLVTSAGADLVVPLPPVDTERGTLSGAFLVGIGTIGVVTFEVWLEDAAGNASNRLAGSFEVLVNDSAADWREVPGAASLQGALGGRVLQALAVGGGTVVAVGDGGRIVTAPPDLGTWTARSSGVAHALRGIAWSGGAFVAVGRDDAGEAVVLRSVNGRDWSVRHRAGCTAGSPCTTAAALHRVIWAGNRFVAVGSEQVPGLGRMALILDSPDGLAWQQRAAATLPVGSDEDLGVGGLAWSGTRFVAVGQARDGSAGVWTSTDGIRWAARATPITRQHVLRDVTWGRGRFVAVGWGGTAPVTLRSADGLSWEGDAGTEPLSAMNAVATGPNRHLAVSNVFRAASTDGRRWTQTPAALACGNGLVWDQDRWIAVGTTACVSP